MKFNQYYLDCLSHASYLIGDESTGRAVVVDPPQRDVSEYLSDSAELGMRIELVIETHFHADFLSGHLELAAATGGQDRVLLGCRTGVRLHGGRGRRALLPGAGAVGVSAHPPGHTPPESLSIVIYEHPYDTQPYGVLTGDTLFVGDVGRPDLLASIGFSREELADKLYDSLHDKLMTLPDTTRVYPAHGAGSACGKNLSTDLWSTMGEQRRTNYALRAGDKATFMELVTEGQPPAPGYFVYDAILNRKDRALLDEAQMPAPMTYSQVREAMNAGAMLVDGRTPEEFARGGHLRGAINIGLEGRYAEFAGSVVRPDVDIVLMTEPGMEREGKNRLARIGFDRVVGYLAEPYQTMFTHRDDVEVASRLTANGLGERMADVPELQIVDVRNPGEAAAGMIAGAVNIPVGQLPARVDELDPRKPTVVYCAGGYRSSVAASLLRQHASPMSVMSWAATAPGKQPSRTPERKRKRS